MKPKAEAKISRPKDGYKAETISPSSTPKRLKKIINTTADIAALQPFFKVVWKVKYYFIIIFNILNRIYVCESPLFICFT